jgi:hypothetical protein
MGAFCNHKWKMENFKFENELDKFKDSNIEMDEFTARELAKRGVITVAKCEICGKIKHIKTIL